MAEPEDDVLGKLDALLRRHQPSDPDIPVLTDVVVPSPLDLDAIPVLTDEVLPGGDAGQAGAPELPPFPELLPEPGEAPAAADTPAPPPKERVLPAPALPLEFELPPDARYVALDPGAEAPAAPAPAEPAPEAGIAAAAPAEDTAPPATTPVPALSEETIQLIADTIKADVAEMLDARLQEALARQLKASLHGALDRALSSMLDQFVVHIEEVVRVTIASELEKQLAGPRRPEP